MMYEFLSILAFMRGAIERVFAMDVSRVRLESPNWAIGAGALLILVVIAKVIFSRNADARTGSGYFIERRHQRPFAKRLKYASTAASLSIVSVLLLAVLARPYVENFERAKVVESREVCYLEDVSMSMGWPFGTGDISSAQVVREALMRHLSARRGYADKSCLWVFANNSYKIENFTIDDKAFAFQVYGAPYVASDPKHPLLPWIESEFNLLRVAVPYDRILFRDKEGGTNLARALGKIIEHFRLNGSKDIRHRALLVITDAAANTYPANELATLQAMGVRIYLIYVQPNEAALLANGESGNQQLANARRLIDEISGYGGKAFLIQNRDEDKVALARVFDEINRLEPRRERVVERVEREYVFQIPLALAIFGCVAAILLAGCIAEIAGGRYP